MYIKGIIRAISRFFEIFFIIIGIVIVVSWGYSIISKSSLIHSIRLGFVIAGLIILAMAMSVGVSSSPSLKYFADSKMTKKSFRQRTVYDATPSMNDYRLALMIIIALTGFFLFLFGLYIS